MFKYRLLTPGTFRLQNQFKLFSFRRYFISTSTNRYLNQIRTDAFINKNVPHHFVLFSTPISQTIDEYRNTHESDKSTVLSVNDQRFEIIKMRTRSESFKYSANRKHNVLKQEQNIEKEILKGIRNTISYLYRRRRGGRGGGGVNSKPCVIKR